MSPGFLHQISKIPRLGAIRAKTIWAKMFDLPQELQDIIFSCLDNEDLWVLVQVSRPLRQ
jgi:hypothetical protein